MVNVFAFARPNYGRLEVDPWSNQTKDYKIYICCCYANHTTLPVSQDNVKDYLWTIVSVPSKSSLVCLCNTKQ